MDRASLIAAMQITAAPTPTPVTVPEWGTVHVRRITVEEADEMAADESTITSMDKKSRIARNACRVLCDEKGVLLFDPNSQEDVALVRKQPWDVLSEVMAAGSRKRVPEEKND